MCEITWQVWEGCTCKTIRRKLNCVQSQFPIEVDGVPQGCKGTKEDTVTSPGRCRDCVLTDEMCEAAAQGAVDAYPKSEDDVKKE